MNIPAESFVHLETSDWQLQIRFDGRTGEGFEGRRKSGNLDARCGTSLLKRKTNGERHFPHHDDVEFERRSFAQRVAGEGAGELA